MIDGSFHNNFAAQQKYSDMKRVRIIFIALTAINSVTAQNEIPDRIDSRNLNDIIDNGEKPQIIGENGIIVVDLPNIVKNKPVSNILEALGYLPGVLNNNFMLGLAGATFVTTILNCHPSNVQFKH